MTAEANDWSKKGSHEAEMGDHGQKQQRAKENGNGDGSKWTGLSYLDLDSQVETLPDMEMAIIKELTRPTTLPLPGAVGHLWRTPNRKMVSVGRSVPGEDGSDGGKGDSPTKGSPECEFGEATMFLKKLKLNPNVQPFEMSSSSAAIAQTTSTTSSGAGGNWQAVENKESETLNQTRPTPTSTSTPGNSKPLNAASAPFVPSISIQMPPPAAGGPAAAPTAQTIHINNLTANLNYHWVQTTSQGMPPAHHTQPMMTGKMSGHTTLTENMPPPPNIMPMPFVAPNTFPPPMNQISGSQQQGSGYIHPFSHQSAATSGASGSGTGSDAAKISGNSGQAHQPVQHMYTHHPMQGIDPAANVGVYPNPMVVMQPQQDMIAGQPPTQYYQHPAPGQIFPTAHHPAAAFSQSHAVAAATSAGNLMGVVITTAGVGTNNRHQAGQASRDSTYQGMPEQRGSGRKPDQSNCANNFSYQGGAVYNNNNDGGSSNANASNGAGLTFGTTPPMVSVKGKLNDDSEDSGTENTSGPFGAVNKSPGENFGKMGHSGSQTNFYSSQAPHRRPHGPPSGGGGFAADKSVQPNPPFSSPSTGTFSEVARVGPSDAITDKEAAAPPTVRKSSMTSSVTVSNTLGPQRTEMSAQEPELSETRGVKQAAAATDISRATSQGSSVAAVVKALPAAAAAAAAASSGLGAQGNPVQGSPTVAVHPAAGPAAAAAQGHPAARTPVQGHSAAGPVQAEGPGAGRPSTAAPPLNKMPAESTRPTIAAAADPPRRVELDSVADRYQEEAKKGEPAAPAGSSWARHLFSAGKSSDPSGASLGEKPCARILPFSETESAAAGPSDPTSSSPQIEDAQYKELARWLSGYTLNHYAPSILPRGLTNRSNWCFVNAILQALLACPPFYNLMKNLPTIGGLKSGKSLTPMTDSLVEFVNEFAPLENLARAGNASQKKEKKMKKEELRTGHCLEPSYVYKMLLNLNSDTFKVIEGRQEDAEEFLTCLLNGISDEMHALLKYHIQEEAKNQPVEQAEDLTEQANVTASSAMDDPEDWQEVGAKGKSCVTRRVAEHPNHAAVPQTPVQIMALGTYRSNIRSDYGDASATLQPFFTVQLDIQDASIHHVNEALESNFKPEHLDGYISSFTKEVVPAKRHLTLEEIPPILILHIKRFIYDGVTGGVQKLMKTVNFSVDLEIPKGFISDPRNMTLKQRQYKLFAVVYHNGREATKGHYVTAVYHTGFSTWLHCDDSIVQETAEESVLQPSPNSTPYILFYRRCDTLVGNDKSAAAASNEPVNRAQRV